MSSMATAADKSPVIVQSLRFDDIDAMASVMTVNSLEFIPLRPGPFDGRFCQIDLGGMEFRRVVHAPLLMHGALKPDCVSLHVLMRPAGSFTFNGDAFSASTLMIMTEGVAAQAICPTEQDRVRIGFPAEAFHRMIDAYGVRAFPRGVHRMLLLREDQSERMVSVFAAMTDLAESMPNLLAVPGLDEALTEECHRLLAAVLSDPEDRPEGLRQTREMLRQVGAADGFLRANIDRPVYTDELCAALHVSARTLHQSFAAVYGMSPHAYLKRRRLVLVRRALRSAREDRPMVKSIVLAHGFWHLGRFAHEYAAMFGEMPSETLGRGRRREEPASV